MCYVGQTQKFLFKFMSEHLKSSENNKTYAAVLLPNLKINSYFSTDPMFIILKTTLNHLSGQSESYAILVERSSRYFLKSNLIGV